MHHSWAKGYVQKSSKKHDSGDMSRKRLNLYIVRIDNAVFSHRQFRGEGMDGLSAVILIVCCASYSPVSHSNLPFEACACYIKMTRSYLCPYAQASEWFVSFQNLRVAEIRLFPVEDGGVMKLASVVPVSRCNVYTLKCVVTELTWFTVRIG